MPEIGAWLLPLLGLAWLTLIVLNGNTIRWAREQFKGPDSRPLYDRLIGLAKEVESFLEQLGPEREITWRSGMSGSEFTEENNDLLVRGRKMEAMF